MSLRKPPTVTPAMLAANRANAQKSTGPRTAQGRNRIVLNALKHGQHACNFRENLLRAKSKDDAELFQWILDQVHGAFEFRAPWQAEQLAQQVWCAFGRQERRAHAAARQRGKGRVKLHRRSASLWALAWTPRRLGGLGAKPVYAVKSTDRFLTCLSRIQVEIKGKPNGLLKLWLRRSPLRVPPLPLWGEVAAWGLAQKWAAAEQTLEVH